MVKLNKIYTRTGDRGQSGLVDGSRREKFDPRFVAIGDVDEANAAVGFACVALSANTTANAVLKRVQNDLFDLGADLATPGEVDGALRLDAHAVDRLEDEIDRLNETLEPLTSFVLPGGAEAAARLHLARTAVRRAERAITRLNHSEAVSPPVLAYINRLSDLLFQMARMENDQGRADVLWIPGGAA